MAANTYWHEEFQTRDDYDWIDYAEALRLPPADETEALEQLYHFDEARHSRLDRAIRKDRKDAAWGLLEERGDWETANIDTLVALYDEDPSSFDREIDE